MGWQLDSIDLGQMYRMDEYAEAPVRAIVETALDGTPIIWEGSKGGIYIVIGGDDKIGIQKEKLDELYALAGSPDSEYTLTHTDTGESMQVRFANESQPCVSATPLVPRKNPTPTDWYLSPRLVLMEV